MTGTLKGLRERFLRHVTEEIEEGCIDDVMRTPSMNDLSARTLCNLPASAKEVTPEGAQPAIGMQNVLGFLMLLMSLPIEPMQP
jgi:hypothetical protein